eukprot:scaffold62360_cov39-Attheya_sp.AAC.1
MRPTYEGTSSYASSQFVLETSFAKRQPPWWHLAMADHGAHSLVVVPVIINGDGASSLTCHVQIWLVVKGWSKLPPEKSSKRAIGFVFQG